MSTKSFEYLQFSIDYSLFMCCNVNIRYKKEIQGHGDVKKLAQEKAVTACRGEIRKNKNKARAYAE